ncbi:Alpha-D-ribose 1-methylphosphonate 5-triphosphate synthase subunit PhnG [Pseudovibrio axinellae]|uniref:Alpha-D-ribose 1-methylphosphonate 5-triphosphate synthase subunit PhnG n=1 Tax=Pseudovibrio axinellae TaxID=989403 RepID=A0A161V711_9HYPH|nr:phosphonate C-P lyase system protein PhnG [Pseudovibrio axinellae]KZL20701.1 Alpha-D-ribose 1-methylphosphonate 5-triphosphate synthase subunit PhnG [Pseudovibrio axinellae]SER25294.1 alpha-D-ribose 1-methylphosphonate 5-triphosphate synthase subunit PhnG [Pseudovibrio axinellae]
MRASSLKQHSPEIAARQNAMGILAKASAQQISDVWKTLGIEPSYSVIRPAEIGLVMVRGRSGGTGAPFNLCEATVTRCVVALEDGTTGFGQALGRDKTKVLQTALIDALWQLPAHRDSIESKVLAPLAKSQELAEQETRAEVAATKVDFFTMVRGE